MRIKIRSIVQSVIIIVLCSLTSSESLPSASRSIMSTSSSATLSPDSYPNAQLFPAPLPSFEV